MPTNYKFNKIFDDKDTIVYEDQTKTLEVEISKIKTGTFLDKAANTNFNTEPFKKPSKEKLNKSKKWQMKVIEKAQAAFTSGKEIVRDTFASKKEAKKAAQDFMNNKAEKIIRQKAKETMQKTNSGEFIQNKDDVMGEGFANINVDLPEAFK